MAAGRGFLFGNDEFLLPDLDEGSMGTRRNYLAFDIETARRLGTTRSMSVGVATEAWKATGVAAKC